MPCTCYNRYYVATIIPFMGPSHLHNYRNTMLVLAWTYPGNSLHESASFSISFLKNFAASSPPILPVSSR